ncbi:pentapeptide repeat-containing protein [Jiella sonneratiae]|uniref:Pentapeptide repeat-containing protein n=1 Tax=Jiella sonneratiae TaxID=2816856 RepID=A0ABS3IZY0_9HYPH|nr:pentapeptide repeat-containing protein [Jiella sonneratiae]MBO0902973.1 pentapeptide repeat-containing protein [Jiella sonneratiae]
MSGEEDDELREICEELLKDVCSVFYTLLFIASYCFLTVAGISDEDFFTKHKSVELPIIGIDVPTQIFMIAGSISVTAIFIFFLITLWKLSDMSRSLTDAGMRSIRLRTPFYAAWVLKLPKRARRYNEVSLAFAVALIVLSGPLLTGYLWVRSFVRHDLLSSSVLGFLFVATVLAMVGLRLAIRQAAKSPNPPSGTVRETAWPTLFSRPFRRASAGLFILAAVPMFLATAWPIKSGERTDAWTTLARADLAEANFTQMPATYQYREDFVEEFRSSYLGRNRPQGESVPARQAFENEWRRRRQFYIQTLSRTNLRGFDMRYADIRKAFMVGADIRDTSFDRALLLDTNMEAVNLEDTSFVFAHMDRLQLPASNLVRVVADSAFLNDAVIEDAFLQQSSFEDTIAWRGRFDASFIDRVSFARARLGDASFRYAYLKNVSMRDSLLERTSFEGAVLVDVDFADAEGLRPEQFSMATMDEATRATLPATIRAKLSGDCPPRRDLPFPFATQWWTQLESFRERIGRICARGAGSPQSPKPGGADDDTVTSSVGKTN